MTEQPLDIASFISLVIEALESAGVEYLIGGAIAAWAWGEPRATQDLDLVVNIPLETVGRLSKALEQRDMLVPAEVIMNALTENRADIPIHAIHSYSGFKADLYPLRADDELRRSAFQRRHQIDFGPPLGKVYIHSPEDLVIYKLLYFGMRQQSKHARDIAAILRAKTNRLDFEYIDHWVDRFGLRSVWTEMLDNIRPE